MNATCPWGLFDDHEKEILDSVINKTGLISSMVTLWFLLTYFYSSLSENRSYYNIGCFLLTAWIRRSAYRVVGHFVDKKSELWPNVPNCKVFGFFETFLAVHEVECLTHVCIERFVIAKYNLNGWDMPKKNYVMFRVLCVLFACVYALAPALGIGSYGLDFTCSSCTMHMDLPDGWSKYLVAAIFFFRSIKPVIVMIFMLKGCKEFEREYNDSPASELQRQITWDAIIMTGISMVCWMPIGVIRGWVVLTQLVYGSGVFLLPPPAYVAWALLLHWNSLTPVVFALFLLDPNIRSATLQLRPSDLLAIKDKTE